MYLFLIFNVLALSSCDNESHLNPSRKQVFYNVKYGTHWRHSMDIVLPENRNTNTPVVIFIHGGAWVAGSKEVFSTEINLFADAGIACATMNYRYASDIADVHHPALPEDIALAVDFVASKADVWDISDNRFGLVGHSAGGHLALITSYAFNTGRIKACAAWAGPLNFTDSDQLNIDLAPEMLEVYMGFPLVSTVDTLKYRQASPFHAVNSSTVPTLLVYATNDEAVPFSNAQRMEQKLQNLQLNYQFVTLSGATHIWTGQYLQTARNSTLSWFQGTLND